MAATPVSGEARGLPRGRSCRLARLRLAAAQRAVEYAWTDAMRDQHRALMREIETRRKGE
jgi:hypothetical protein